MRAYREAGQRSPGVLVSSNVHATAAWLCYDSFANDDLTTLLVVVCRHGDVCHALPFSAHALCFQKAFDEE